MYLLLIIFYTDLEQSVKIPHSNLCILFLLYFNLLHTIYIKISYFNSYHLLIYFFFLINLLDDYLFGIIFGLFNGIIII